MVLEEGQRLLIEDEEKKRAKLDAAWKEAIRKYFKDFTQLCWPDIFDKIDWTKGYTFLEQEFHAILRPQEIGKRITDKLIQVSLKNNENILVLIHVEIQGIKTKEDFAERMFIYRYRIFDVHRINIASFAILLDNNRKWRPSVYEQDCWGSKLRLEYPILKIIDFQKRKTELENSPNPNPFALVILAQLAALETANDPKTRLISRYQLTKKLYSYGKEKDDVIDILRFLDEILVLPNNLALEYDHQVKQLEKELQVSFITTSEERWLDQGINLGERSMLLRLLQRKFGTVPEHYRKKIDQANAESLLAWGDKILECQNLQAIFES